jgi:hypothetical protein
MKLTDFSVRLSVDASPTMIAMARANSAVLREIDRRKVLFDDIARDLGLTPEEIAQAKHLAETSTLDAQSALYAIDQIKRARINYPDLVPLLDSDQPIEDKLYAIDVYRMMITLP